MNEIAPVQMSSLAQGCVAVVFGASGGVGAALVEHLRASDHFSAVVALSRRSAPSFDLTDEESIAHAVASEASTAASTAACSAASTAARPPCPSQGTALGRAEALTQVCAAAHPADRVVRDRIVRDQVVWKVVCKRLDRAHDGAHTLAEHAVVDDGLEAQRR